MPPSIHLYPLILRMLHWLTVIIVIALFASGLWMVDLNYYNQWYQIAPYWHRSFGILLASVTLLRLLLRFILPMPTINGSLFIQQAAHFGHCLLYLLLFTLFTSGYLISTSDGRGIEIFYWFEVPSMGELFNRQSDLSGQVHYYTAWSVIIFASMHGLMALKHHFIDRDNTLRKMTGG